MLAILLSCTTVLGKIDTTKLKSETHYGAYFNNEKIGYFSDFYKVIDEDGRQIFIAKYDGYLEQLIEDTINTSNFSYTYIFDLESRVLTKYSQEFVDKLFSNKDDIATDQFIELMTSSLTADYLGASNYNVTELDGEISGSKTVLLPPLLLEDALAEVDFIQNELSFSKETSIEIYDLDFSEELTISSKLKFIKTHEYNYAGESFTHIEIETVIDGLATVAEYDKFGNYLNGDLGGIIAKIEPEGIAKSLDEDRHFSVLASVDLDAPISADENLEEVTLKIFSNAISDGIIENGRQKIIEANENYSIVKITSGQKNNSDFQKLDNSKYLETSEKFNLNSGKLLSINPTPSLAGLSDEEKVQELLDFTYNYIDYQFTLEASLNEIIDTQKGDCTEYAQLFVSLARLNKIPAREVSGLVYNYDTEKPGFYGHAWAEVFLNGRWKEVDPGWNEFDVDATHLTLSKTYFDSYSRFDERIELVGFR